MSKITRVFAITAVLAVFVVLSGCGSSDTKASSGTGTPIGSVHPPDWITTHGAAYLQKAAASDCTECHGADLKGGISQVSCFTASYNGQGCHAGGPGGHPTGWADASQHGVAAKSAPGTMSGMAACQSCHGGTYQGGSATTSCLSCHTTAPHAPAPWRGGTYTHTTTNEGNATACAGCHRNPTAPQSTPNGCFNNTLCHGSISAHAADWALPQNHGVTAESNFSTCKTCHGNSYTGGSSGVSCYQCHNGPGLNHPAANWVISNHVASATSNMTSCQKCHGSNYLGGGSSVACTKCHMDSPSKVHMTAWYPDVRLNHRQYAKTNGTSTCATQYCHGTNLTGVTGSGPSCSSCHTWPYTGSTTCTTCHGTPPNGTTSPNTAGRHAVHAALNKVNCATCHLGAGSGTAYHQNGTADVIINTVYYAKSGVPSYSSTGDTCAKISCHGGQTTPNWLTGSIDVNTQCSLCHTAGTTEYNSQNSGKHGTHANKGIGCTSCHDTTLLQNYHFNDLDTTAMTEADFTIKTSIGYNGSTCATPGCHGSKNWQ